MVEGNLKERFSKKKGNRRRISQRICRNISQCNSQKRLHRNSSKALKGITEGLSKEIATIITEGNPAGIVEGHPKVSSEKVFKKKNAEEISKSNTE